MKMDHGSKQKTAISIMTKYPTGHRFEDCTAEIGLAIGLDDPASRSMYRFCHRERAHLLPDGWVPSVPGPRKARTINKKVTTEHSGEIKPKKVAKIEKKENRGTPERLALIAQIAAKTERKPKPTNVKNRIETLAASGVNPSAETEESRPEDLAAA